MNCSFCGRSRDEAGKLISSAREPRNPHRACICPACVESAEEVLKTPPAMPGGREPNPRLCSFCNRRQNAVTLFANGSAICEECLAMCRYILAEEDAAEMS